MIPTAATPMTRTGAWSDVAAKAARLVRENKVTIGLNKPEEVTGHVIGDHSEYNCRITRSDPSSSRIDWWECDCPWNDYAWDRTRQWKKLEGRPCSHVFALYWKGLATPLDMSDQEEGFKAAPGQRTRPHTEQEMFDQNGGQLPGMEKPVEDTSNLPRTFMPDGTTLGPDGLPVKDISEPEIPEPVEVTPGDQITQPGAPGQNPFNPQRGPVGPNNPFAPQRTQPGVPQRQQLQLFDITAPPGGQPVPPTSPVSIPGLNPPGWQNPGNPTQFPGTFSHVAASPMPGGTFLCPEHGLIPSEKVLDDEQGFTCRQCGQQVKSQLRTSSHGETYEPAQRVLIDVQLREPNDPSHWVPATVVEHRPDTEGEAWDEDDYLVEFDELPAELEDHVGVDGRTMSVPESWVHGEHQPQNDWTDQEPEADASRATYWGEDRIHSNVQPVVTIYSSQFHWGSADDDLETWVNEMLRHNQRAVFQLRNPVMLEASGGKIPMPGAEPIGTSMDGLPKYRTLDLGWDHGQQRRMNQNELNPSTGLQGPPQQEGQFAEVRAGRRGEIVEIEPFMKMVMVHIPIDDSGPLHPHLFKGWVDYKDIVPLINGTPTPFRQGR